MKGKGEMPINKNNKFVIYGLFIASLFLTFTAEAKRALVKFKSESTIQYLNNVSAQIRSGNITSRSNKSMDEVYAQVLKAPVSVEESLDHLDLLVIDYDSTAELVMLEKNPLIEKIETEVFHPAPKPIRGSVHINNIAFAQDFSSINTALVKTMDIKPEGFKETKNTPWGILAVRAQQAWNASNYGAASRVLILDTGIDKDHPSLKSNFEMGKDFVNDGLTPYPFADKVGHGTHVAGTIAGAADETGFVGVAPKAKILAGRVCNTQSCSNIAISSGINWGIEQKVDVISMSLGGDQITEAEKAAVKKAEAAGVVVVAASGNSSKASVSYPAALPSVVAVGAIDIKKNKAGFSQWGPELDIVAPGVDVVSSVPVGSGRDSKVSVNFGNGETVINSVTFEGARTLKSAETSELVWVGFGSAKEYAGVDIKSKYVFVARGGNVNLIDKIQAAINGKALGVLIYNNEPGLPHGAISDADNELPVGVFMVEQADGEKMKQAITSGKKLSGKFEVLKTNYSSYDGTSMATPHVSGVVALIKSANKALKPVDVRDLLKKSATPLSPNNQNQFGAGLVNAEAVVNAALKVHSIDGQLGLH